MPNTFLSRIKVTPNYTCQWYQKERSNSEQKDLKDYSWLFDKQGNRIAEYTIEAPRNNKHHGYLSEKSMVRLKERINYMIYISTNKTLRKSLLLPVTKYKLVFIVLTLPSAQLHSDREISKTCFEPFLKVMRVRWKCNNYLWKKESQNNGNIHYHIISDTYINWEIMRNEWNFQLEKLGYISRSKSKNPNSTDIHAIYKLSNPAAYLAGYIGKKDLYKDSDKYEKWTEHYYKELLEITACDLKTKKEEGIKRPIEGKIYDCNEELKRIKPIWNDRIEFQQEIDLMRGEGSKYRDEIFFKLTFINPNQWSRIPHLKLLLDHFIKVAYSKN